MVRRRKNRSKSTTGMPRYVIDFSFHIDIIKSRSEIKEEKNCIFRVTHAIIKDATINLFHVHECLFNKYSNSREKEEDNIFFFNFSSACEII